MRTDPRIGFWISVALALVGAGWIALFALMGESLVNAIGDLAFALTFIALTLSLSAAIVALLFRRFIRVRADLRSGRDAVARWQVGPTGWRAFQDAAGAATRADHRVTLALILGFTAVICGAGAALNPDDAGIFALIGLGIALVGGLGFWLGRGAISDHLTYRDGVVIIGKRGLLVNGVLHVWGYAGSRLDGAALMGGEPPGGLTFTYSWISRTGRQYATAHVPLPDTTTETDRVLKALDLNRPAGRRG